jgi:hypothetical protein
MVGKNKKSAAAPDTRKPKHSNDSARANKQSKNGMRDAATASSWGQQGPGTAHYQCTGRQGMFCHRVAATTAGVAAATATSAL